MAIINVKNQTDLSGFYIVYKGSTMNERPGNFGISHFWEHLKCKTFDDLQDLFDQDCISWNAYTSDDLICFHFTGLEEYLSSYKDQIIDRMLTFDITNEQFENEKKIVLEEFGDCFNEQGKSHVANLYRIKLNNFGPIGRRCDLENLKLKDMIEYNKIYSTPHDIIHVSKTSEYNRDINFSTNIFDNQLIWGDFSNEIEKNNEYIGKASIANLSPVITSDFAHCHFINSILGSGLKSPLYEKLREKRGLVYFVHCYIDRVTPNSGINTISTETSEDNAEEVVSVIKEVLGNPQKYMTQERFDIVKKSMIIQLKKNEINRHANVSKWMIPIEWQIEPLLNTITLDQLAETYAKYYDFDKWYKSNDQTEKW